MAVEGHVGTAAGTSAANLPYLKYLQYWTATTSIVLTQMVGHAISFCDAVSTFMATLLHEAATQSSCVRQLA